MLLLKSQSYGGIAKESNHFSFEHLALLLVWETVRENPVLMSQDDLRFCAGDKATQLSWLRLRLKWNTRQCSVKYRGAPAMAT